jgi:DNA-binding NarL/FixJ family response regulator
VPPSTNIQKVTSHDLPSLSETLLELYATNIKSDVLSWMTEGKNNSAIAMILGAKPKMITKHLKRIFAKLGVETGNVALEVSAASRA